MPASSLVDGAAAELGSELDIYGAKASERVQQMECMKNATEWPLSGRNTRPAKAPVEANSNRDGEREPGFQWPGELGNSEMVTKCWH